MVILESGMVKLNLPFPKSVSLISLPFSSLTVTVSRAYPSSGAVVMVTVSPFLARLSDTVSFPFAISSETEIP